MARRVRVSPIPGGIVRVLKSPGVYAMVRDSGDAAAARCNAIARRPSGASKAPVYESRVKPLRYLYGAVVHTANGEAHVDNLRSNTLRKGCGV